MADKDLAICLEGIRRAYVYLDGYEEWLEHPRKAGKERGEISIKGLAKAFEAIARHCPISDHLKERFERYSRMPDESPWQTVAEFGWHPQVIKSILSDTLRQMAESFGFKPEMYDEYIPKW